ncbi:hypothetical protein MUK42_19700 [Musa troglodytarum]|uniref:RNase III domain-containing protein n=1 Tax=Musa troglodytarum TaxID=320322 RepID=A0A9E7K1P8_9LILI|nr:hypothetical protein MUK42_19700 [Musa troglodytarum]
MTEEISVVVGNPCDKDHRWMCSKTIADCVEALVGAYYAGGGLPAALQVMRWLGVNIKIDKVLVEEAKMSAFHWYHLSKVSEIEFLESKLNYMFTVKGLLLEAITHPSLQELGLDYCYQRLEFLGDSVWDLLITWHHFLSRKNIDPGVLTDLRSASVNNENFAQVALKDDLLVGCGRDKDMKTAKAQAALCLLKQLKDNGYLENNSKLTKSKLNNPVHPITLPTRMDKGGPRTALFKLCRMLQWPMPEFESREEKFRPPITINGLKTPNFNLFMTKLPLHIPNSKVLTHGRAKNRQEKCTRFNSTCAAP